MVSTDSFPSDGSDLADHSGLIWNGITEVCAVDRAHLGGGVYYNEYRAHSAYGRGGGLCQLDRSRGVGVCAFGHYIDDQRKE